MLDGCCKRQLSLKHQPTKDNYPKTCVLGYLIKCVLMWVRLGLWTCCVWYSEQSMLLKEQLPLFPSNPVLICHPCCLVNGLPSGLRTWAPCLLATTAVWVPLSFIPLIVELFCVIDKLQVWYSEGGWGSSTWMAVPLGMKLTHLDSSIETILCSGRCVLED